MGLQAATANGGAAMPPVLLEGAIPLIDVADYLNGVAGAADTPTTQHAATATARRRTARERMRERMAMYFRGRFTARLSRRIPAGACPWNP